MDKKEKVLIIKTGYNEFLEYENNSKIVSLGDVLRTTPLLHLYKNDYVTWVSDKYAFPLLEQTPYIDKLLPLNFITTMQILDEEFDTLINLEKNHDICKLSHRIDAWRKYGFRFDKEHKKAEAYDRAHDILAVSADKILKKENQKTSQELLFEMVGAKWNGEKYILGYKPKTKEIYDIGLNMMIGKKWPTKAWPSKNWDILEKKLLKDGFKISRQDDKRHPEIVENIYSYMDWINSSKLIITSDSLGLHLALALNKNVLGLFGPTPNKEVYFYGRGKAILPETIPECITCFKGFCERGKNCMEDISVERVYEEVKNT